MSESVTTFCDLFRDTISDTNKVMIYEIWILQQVPVKKIIFVDKFRQPCEITKHIYIRE